MRHMPDNTPDMDAYDTANSVGMRSDGVDVEFGAGTLLSSRRGVSSCIVGGIGGSDVTIGARGGDGGSEMG